MKSTNTKLDLWSTKEAADMMGISVWTFLDRARKKEVKPYRKRKKLENFYSRSQIDLIAEKYNSVENPFTEVIYVHTIFHIYPSKLNYLEL
jgi:hypothetical protein